MNTKPACSRAGHRPFSTIFIVGAPRSGTTLLAVLMDRHSRIAVPPETQFFSGYLSGRSPGAGVPERGQRLARALDFSRLQDLNLCQEDVLPIFEQYENSDPGLFRALLESYARRKGKPRVGEKSPKHIEHVAELFEHYPEAKVICLVRDGRDVVLSLLRVPWAEPGNPRRFSLFCTEWNGYAEMALRYQRVYPSSRYLLVRYEDILQDPPGTLQGVCSFVGEPFEPEQLQPREASQTVPEWEEAWKGKASGLIDPNRAHVWRRHPEPETIWRMNVMMGGWLKRFGYPDTSSLECPLHLRLGFHLKKIPYYPRLQPFSLLGLKALRLLRPHQ